MQLNSCYSLLFIVWYYLNAEESIRALLLYSFYKHSVVFHISYLFLFRVFFLCVCVSKELHLYAIRFSGFEYYR